METHPNNPGMHQSAAVPLACRGMCNYSTIKVPVLVSLCLCDHIQLCQQCGLESEKRRVEKKRKHLGILLDDEKAAARHLFCLLV